MHLTEDGMKLELNNKVPSWLDFTFNKYHGLCEAIIASDYIPITMNNYLTENISNVNKYVILRHDVDKMPENALEMAKIENNLGIQSTYYFRSTKNVFRPDIMKQIYNLGHEIGYHYEDLVKAKGNTVKAIEIFEKELSNFRSICDIKTICMHGNSLSKWDNRDLWKSYSFQDFGIVGEAYVSIDFKKVLYLSDSGGLWNNSTIRIKDTIAQDSLKLPVQLNNTDNIIDIFRNNTSYIKQIYLLVHPDRWNDSMDKWLFEYITKKFRNSAKVLYKITQWKND